MDVVVEKVRYRKQDSGESWTSFGSESLHYYSDTSSWYFWNQIDFMYRLASEKLTWRCCENMSFFPGG